MRVRMALSVAILVMTVAGVRAGAVTLEDIVELTQASISDVVLIELIEMDDSAYPLTPSRLRSLKAAGVSDQVLLALLRSGRSADPDGPPTERRDVDRRTSLSDGCRTRTRAACEPLFMSSVPVLVPARPAGGPGGLDRAPGPRTSLGFGGVSGLSGLSTITPATTGTASTTRSKPTYWGWGGKKRPGSWNGHSETTK